MIGAKKTTAVQEPIDAREELYMASAWKLMGRKFFKHKLAIIGMTVLGLFYSVAIFCEFFAPADIFKRNVDRMGAPPQRIRILHEGQLRRPFVYDHIVGMDEVTLAWIFEFDETKPYPIRFFVKGDEYEFWGLFKTRIHFIGVDEPGTLFLFGGDELGRDLLSRILYAARVSLSIGLVGVAISFILGCIIGGVSGYFGGSVDMLIQRLIEFLGGIPNIPLWIVLSAAVPTTWSPLRVYFGITVILSIIGWTGLARTVRGKILQLKTEDYVLAAKIAGCSEMRIITRHLLPGFMSYLIVSLTLGIPGMILGETSLSFLGLGLRAPVVSWGVLLQQAQNIRTVAFHPWLLLPGIFVIIAVLCFNFVGDGLRDAADPYKQ